MNNNPSGRPPRIPDTPISLLYREMVESARMSRRVRDLLLVRVKRIGTQLSTLDPPSPSETTLSEELVSIMAAMGRVVESSAKLLTVRGNVVDDSPTTSTEEVLQELTKGKRK